MNYACLAAEGRKRAADLGAVVRLDLYQVAKQVIPAVKLGGELYSLIHPRVREM
jgi:hypothetical protein